MNHLDYNVRIRRNRRVANIAVITATLGLCACCVVGWADSWKGLYLWGSDPLKRTTMEQKNLAEAMRQKILEDMGRRGVSSYVIAERLIRNISLPEPTP